LGWSSLTHDDAITLADSPWLAKHVPASGTRGSILDDRIKRLIAGTGNITQPKP
jgi:hypothetical protein